MEPLFWRMMCNCIFLLIHMISCKAFAKTARFLGEAGEAFGNLM